jgi:hypothetical protein
MRWIWTDIGFYDTRHEARAARRRAIARRQVLREPEPMIVKWHDGGFLLEGAAVVGPWSQTMNHNGVVRERLTGEPVKSPRPKRTKNQRRS